MAEKKHVLQHIMRVKWVIHFEGHVIKKITFKGHFIGWSNEKEERQLRTL